MLDSILPWQEKLRQQMVTNPHPAHAYLLYGKKGIGKHLFADQLTRYWLCLTPNHKLPCGYCKSCHLLATSGAHPDFFQLIPTESDFIKVDQVRELVDFVNQTSQISKGKVVVIEPAEALNLNAANALLKSLEEPNGNTRFILVSHQPGQLLATIKSRCIQQLCPMPSKEQALTWLQSQLTSLSTQELTQLWLLAGHTPLYALELYEQDILQQRQRVVADIKKILKQQIVAGQIVESWTNIPLIIIYDWFCSWLHIILSYQLTHDDSQLGMADMAKVLVYMANKIAPMKLLALQQELLTERQKVLRKANFNKLLLLESLLIRWNNLLTTR